MPVGVIDFAIGDIRIGECACGEGEAPREEAHIALEFGGEIEQGFARGRGVGGVVEEPATAA